jgi:hypothetical protein
VVPLEDLVEQDAVYEPAEADPEEDSGEPGAVDVFRCVSGCNSRQIAPAQQLET